MILKKISGADTPTNIISLSEARRRYEVGACRHLQIVVDEDLAEVRCEACGVSLNPIAMLVRLSREESRFEQRRTAMLAEREKLEAKSKTKCEHCGGMTRVRPGR